MTNGFDDEEAKKFLIEKEQREKNGREEERKKILEKVIFVLKKEFEGTPVEVYLVGSILRPYSFSPHSDVDIVLKNYKGDRFALWTKLEKIIDRTVEIIPFETCSFQEFILKEGYKVV